MTTISYTSSFVVLIVTSLSERKNQRKHAFIENNVATIAAGIQPSKALSVKNQCAVGIDNRFIWILCSTRDAITPEQLREKALLFIRSENMLKLCKCLQDIMFEHQTGMIYLDKQLYDRTTYLTGEAFALVQFLDYQATVVAKALEKQYPIWADYLRKCMYFLI